MGKKKFGQSGSKKKTRKEKRKEQRIQKKVNKNEHYFKRFKKEAPIHPSKIPKEPKDSMFGDDPLKRVEKDEDSLSDEEVVVKHKPHEKSLVEKIREASEKSKLLAEKRKVSDKKTRNAQLREANKAEDKQIKHLSTLLKMNKRKKKGKTASLPKIFESDGLDYLLDVTDPEKLKDMKMDEPMFEDDEGEGDFERDLALATGAAGQKDKKLKDSDAEDDSSDAGSDAEELGSAGEVEGDIGTDGSEGDEGEEDVEAEEEEGAEVEDSDEEVGEEDLAAASGSDDEEREAGEEEESDLGSDFDALEGGSDSEEADDVDGDAVDDDEEPEEKSSKKSKKQLKRKLEEDQDEEEEPSEQKKSKKKKKKREGETTGSNDDGVWEDIYGRMRGKDGSILTGVGSDAAAASSGASAAAPARYVPPALRAQQLAEGADDRARRAQLRRRLQGQLNRLSATSARGVLALLEELYAAHSRHDTSQTLTELVHEACVAEAAVRPDRMLMEHALLVAALHANVGSEVGAHFLLKTAQRFHKLLMDDQHDNESKELDNLVMLLSHLYAFRVTDSTVIYDILKIMVERFSAKDVELILTVLRSVGFTMRKDDPVALKELILRLQAQAAAATAGDAAADSSRIRFLLDIVMALRNNNMAKIPHYDPTLGQELSKLLKTLVNPSQTLTELSISLDDLLKAEERGKWWVVGSAWSGALKERQTDTNPTADGEGRGDTAASRPEQQYSAQLLELARQQRMNTDLRRNVFCVLMTAEDYLDGFEKLMRLGLRGPQQEQEMTAVIVGCALRERTHNPFYSHLLERLCSVDRKYQMRVKISVWEHLKQLPTLGSGPASNLAKVLSHLIASGQLTIAVLKVVEFSEMSKPMVRFLRQLLLALLMSAEDTDSVRDLFQRATGPQLKHLRDSLVLFIHHFVLRNKHKLADGETVERLEERAKTAVSVLKAAEGTLRL